MVEAEKAGVLKKDEPRGLTFILVLAGIDTTACLISNGLHRFAPLPRYVRVCWTSATCCRRRSRS